MVEREKIVRDLITKILEENQWKQRDLKINALPFEGANYTSSLFTITLTTDTETLEMFAKVGCITGELRKVLNADWFYEVERIAYTKIIKVYEALQDKHNVPEENRALFPKCYGFDKESGRETVVMENLVSKGYKDWNRQSCTDWEHAAYSVEMLAKFHALSFAYAKEYPEEFEQLAAKLVYKTFSIDNKNEKMDTLWRNTVESKLGLLETELKNKVYDVMIDEYFMYKFQKPIGKAVFVHGDYRLNNILFRREGNNLKGIPVDFQMLHAGCPAEDLIFFIFLGTDQDFRKQYYHKLLDHYYQHLCQALRQLDVDPVETYPRETFDSHMQQMVQFALFLGVFVLPLMVVEVDSTPRPDDIVDIETYNVKPDEAYVTRLKGLVEDCIWLGAV